jgi:hypothetical protein
MADIHFQKQKSDKNLHAHNARERMFETQEKEAVRPVLHFDHFVT